MDKLGQRIVTLRKEKKLSREALAKMIGTSGAIIGRYERGERVPSVEIAKNMAAALGVSLDYLVCNTDLLLDTKLIERIEDIQKLPEEDRAHLYYLMENVLQNVKAKLAFAS